MFLILFNETFWLQRLGYASFKVLFLLFFKYASLRRQLLIDPHLPKDASDSPDFVMDNPLSQNPGKIPDIVIFSLFHKSMTKIILFEHLFAFYLYLIFLLE